MTYSTHQGLLARVRLRFGFAARCEEWLCPSVNWLGELAAPSLGVKMKLDDSTSEAQRRRSPFRESAIYGRAQPFLTSGGEAEASRLLISECNE
jgi:hypothetical protein